MAAITVRESYQQPPSETQTREEQRPRANAPTNQASQKASATARPREQTHRTIGTQSAETSTAASKETPPSPRGRPKLCSRFHSCYSYLCRGTTLPKGQAGDRAKGDAGDRAKGDAGAVLYISPVGGSTSSECLGLLPHKGRSSRTAPLSTQVLRGCRPTPRLFSGDRAL